MPPQDYEISTWFEQEVRVNEPILRTYLSHNESEPADVDDIVQETYRRIIEVKKKQTIRSPKGLLMTIAKNVSRDRIRKKYVSKTFYVADFENINVLDAEEQPSEQLIRSDEVTMLESALRKLPVRCRQVMILRTFENLSYKEIAKRMNISVNTVETQLSRGLNACRKHFKQNGYSFE